MSVNEITDKISASERTVAPPVTAASVTASPNPHPNPDTRQEPKPDNPRLLTKPEIAEYLKVTVRTVDNWMASGILPYQKLGRTVRFNLAKVEQHFAEFHTVARRDSRRTRFGGAEGGLQ